MRRVAWFALAAVLLGGAALAWFLTDDRGAPPPLLSVDLVPRGPLADGKAIAGPVETRPLGGVYAGIVVDAQGQGIAGARVLLVRYNAGMDSEFRGFKPDGSDFDPAKIPVFGDFQVAGEQVTDADGRFRIASGAKDLVQMVVAWKERFAPGFAGTGKPGDEVRVTLTQGGVLKGRVVDPQGHAISKALVELYLQQIVDPTPDREPGQDVHVPVKVRPLSQAPLLGNFLGRVLGPRVLGLDPSSSEALRTTTGNDGTFWFGPWNDEVQIQVVVSHPDYMWTEFDRGADGGVRRPVLRPGETLERTYVLQPGNWIEGRVVSDANLAQGIEGVRIRLEHVVAYSMHPWYRYKTRDTVTREDGSFRLAGLAQGPYVATLTHASFGSQFVPKIPENTTKLVWTVRSRGALLGRLTGDTGERPLGGRVEVSFEGQAVSGVAPHAPPPRQTAVLTKDKTFSLAQLEPGSYLVSVRAGTYASRPQPVEIVAHKIVEATFETGGGGSLTTQVTDTQGRAVDPVGLTLLRIDANGKEVMVATYTGRTGKVTEDGLLPGRYRLEAWAAGFQTQSTEPFELVERRETAVPTIVLRQPAWLRVAAVVDEDGRAPRAEAHLSLREGLGEAKPLWLRGNDVAVRPGQVTLAAVTDDGLSYQETFDAREGEIVTVSVVLKPAPR